MASMLFGLIGHPVAHSLSPKMHEASFRALHLAAEYRAMDVPPEKVRETVLQLREEGYLGVNVTVPHKTAVIPLMDSLDLSAQRLGAVNTIRMDPDGKMVGFNTDASGFLADLRASLGVMPMGKRVMVVGCGGAGRALAIACAVTGANRVALANRTVSKAQALAEEIQALPDSAGCPVTALSDDRGEWVETAKGADLVLQCTTAGLHADDVSILPKEAFHSGQYLYDIVYTAPMTPTMLVAHEAGAWVANGLGMLVRQGAASFRIWTGMEANLAAMRMAVGG